METDALDTMKAAFAQAQEAQAQITAETTKHKTIMSALEATKNAFQAIKG